MKFRTLNNREIRMDILPERYPVRSRNQSKSAGQYNLGRVLLGIYGKFTIILEEFPIPEERLYLDFFLPHHGLAFEYQGIQHDKFNKFFHADKSGFQKSVERDNRKKAWCDLNSVRLIAVRGNPSIEDIKALIQNE